MDGAPTTSRRTLEPAGTSYGHPSLGLLKAISPMMVWSVADTTIQRVGLGLKPHGLSLVHVSGESIPNLKRGLPERLRSLLIGLSCDHVLIRVRWRGHRWCGHLQDGKHLRRCMQPYCEWQALSQSAKARGVHLNALCAFGCSGSHLRARNRLGHDLYISDRNHLKHDSCIAVIMFSNTENWLGGRTGKSLMTLCSLYTRPEEHLAPHPNLRPDDPLAEGHRAGDARNPCVRSKGMPALQELSCMLALLVRR